MEPARRMKLDASRANRKPRGGFFVAQTIVPGMAGRIVSTSSGATSRLQRVNDRTAAMTQDGFEKAKTGLRVASGNFLEMYDFFLFGIYARQIAQTFFPSADPYASLMATFLGFAAGFAMRPIGALVLGPYVDRIGRRKGLILTLSLMACGTILIAFVPGYATIGVVAPLLVVLGRLLQGFSAG